VTAKELDTTALEGQVRGQLIAPDDPAYEEARLVYNAMIDKRPALIVRAADVADGNLFRVNQNIRPAD
jgi:hypothetical protein